MTFYQLDVVHAYQLIIIFIHNPSGTLGVQQFSLKTRDKKIAEIGRFFGEKSDFDGLGKDFAVEKSTEKISAKNC